MNDHLWEDTTPSQRPICISIQTIHFVLDPDERPLSTKDSFCPFSWAVPLYKLYCISESAIYWVTYSLKIYDKHSVKIYKNVFHPFSKCHFRINQMLISLSTPPGGDLKCIFCVKKKIQIICSSMINFDATGVSNEYFVDS